MIRFQLLSRLMTHPPSPLISPRSNPNGQHRLLSQLRKCHRGSNNRRESHEITLSKNCLRAVCLRELLSPTPDSLKASRRNQARACLPSRCSPKPFGRISIYDIPLGKPLSLTFEPYCQSMRVLLTAEPGLQIHLRTDSGSRNAPGPKRGPLGETETGYPGR